MKLEQLSQLNIMLKILKNMADAILRQRNWWGGLRNKKLIDHQNSFAPNPCINGFASFFET